MGPFEGIVDKAMQWSIETNGNARRTGRDEIGIQEYISEGQMGCPKSILQQQLKL